MQPRLNRPSPGKFASLETFRFSAGCFFGFSEQITLEGDMAQHNTIKMMDKPMMVHFEIMERQLRAEKFSILDMCEVERCFACFCEAPYNTLF